MVRSVLDGLSLDQLRTFIAAAEEGSFSAAAGVWAARNPSSVRPLGIWKRNSAWPCSSAPLAIRN